MRTIKAAFSTMGQSSPASVAIDAGRTGGYRYQGDPLWFPGRGVEHSAPREQQQVDAKAIASRKDRIARYCQLRAEGKSRDEAAAAVEVGKSAAKTYEAEFRRQQQGARS